MMHAATVEIMTIGNEILIGDIQDTNTAWLCRLVNSRGGHVTRGVLLRDELGEIAAEVAAVLARGPDVLFTSGGLGPTADDLTLAAVAHGTGRELRLHQEALRMVKAQYDRFHAAGIMAEGGLNPAREKMARLPEGAIPLHNPNGTAPGVLLQAGRTAIICLPGVPSELESILNSSLQPFLDRTFAGGGSHARILSVRCNDESILEPVLSQIVPRHPRVYIKSRATTVGIRPELDITLSVSGGRTDERLRLLDAAVSDLAANLAGLGIVFRERR